MSRDYSFAMPRESTQTRELLMRAGETVFAHTGVHAAQTRDIVRLAGQANDSAVHYHFGSRDGLLLAICERHIQQVEPLRAAAMDAIHLAGQSGDLAALVAAIVRPTFEHLKTESGRDFLLISAQLAGLAAVGTSHPATPLGGTALMDQLTVLELLLRRSLPRAVMVWRIGAMIDLITATLADRARLVNSGKRRMLSDAGFRDELETAVLALLQSPPRGGD